MRPDDSRLPPVGPRRALHGSTRPTKLLPYGAGCVRFHTASFAVFVGSASGWPVAISLRIASEPAPPRCSSTTAPRVSRVHDCRRISLTRLGTGYSRSSVGGFGRGPVSPPGPGRGG